MKKISLQLLIFLGALFLNATQSKAFIYDIPQPGQREFIQDLAGLIDANHQQEIKQAADKILTQTGNPIIVVTINKMADHLDKGKTLRIETFAHFLFDQWEIGSVEIEGFDPETLNRGILLLVSKGDRKARIQLGAGWGRQADGVCKQIMDRVIVPKFKQGNFSEGIKNGFESLAGMIIEISTPKVSIWEAAFKGNIEAVKKHLEQGVDIGSKDQVFDGTPLHHAA